MTLLPQLERELRTAHARVGRRGGGGRGGGGRGLRRALAAVPVAALVAVAVVVAGGAALLLGARGHAGRTGSAPVARTPLTNILAVLRRPQDAADRGFDARGAPGPPDRPLIRLATITPWGGKAFVVPLTEPRDTVALWAPGIGWSGDTTVAEIRDGQAWGPQRGSRFFELVPDGVAKVTFYNGALDGPITGSVTAVVHGNVAAFADSGGGGAHVVRAKWFAADGRVLKRIGFGNPFHAAPVVVRRVLGPDGIDGVRFGASPALVDARVDSLLAQAAPADKRYLGECGVDHSLTWSDARTANGFPNLVAVFDHSRFVGYQYATTNPVHQPLRGIELTTARGLRIGDTLARGRRLYGRAFALSYAQGGSWTLRVAGRVMRGYAWTRSGVRIAWRSVVQSISAGDVGCPALTP